MELKHIKHTKCPYCNSETVEEKRNNRHTNGLFNESRYYACGLQVEFSPNLMCIRESTYNKCKNSPKELEKKKQHEEGRRLLTNYINKMKVSKAFKDSMLQHLTYVVEYT